MSASPEDSADNDSGDKASEWNELSRQAHRLETAYSIIHGVRGNLSVETVADEIVESLVVVGGFTFAELAIDGFVGQLHIKHFATGGERANDDRLVRKTALFIRGQEIGSLTTSCESLDHVEDQSDLLDYVLPTLAMGIDHAVSFAEVMDYRRTLEDRVIERTAQLAEAREQLEHTVEDLREAKAARDRFFANINHEFRTPLTLIQLATDRLSLTASADDATKGKLDEIDAATRRLLNLVDSLLQLAAGDESKLRVTPRELDLATRLQQLVRNWTPLADRNKVTLEYVGPATCPATIDPTAIETIVGNFVSNALKFTPADGRTTVTMTATDATITIAVRDTGIGIEPAFVPKLFSRFERSETATSRGIRGTGIGLSLSKELVDLQHGSIEVIRHDDPSGTSFIVTLPRFQAATALREDDTQPIVPTALAETPQRESAPTIAPAERIDATILIAEDDPTLARNVLEILSGQYRVFAAVNGTDALVLAKQHRPDLLVTDLEMPGMNGVELTREFLALEGTALSPVLIVSAHAGLEKRLAGFDAGAVDYILKPFSASELLARIRSQLALRKLAVKLHEAQKLTALGILSSGLAHELRNPANALVNALEPMWSLLPDSERTPDAAGTALYEVMDTAATKIRELCSHILELSRSGDLVRRPEPLAKLVHRAKLVVSHALERVQLVEDLRHAQPVPCAGALIEQVLINLLDNAAYAAGPGGTVSISSFAADGRAFIEVSDSGPGVPDHLVERIFDPFFTTKPPGEGTGLGLSISRRIALDHGGDLRVVRRTRGTAFSLQLPV